MKVPPFTLIHNFSNDEDAPVSRASKPFDPESTAPVLYSSKPAFFSADLLDPESTVAPMTNPAGLNPNLLNTIRSSVNEAGGTPGTVERLMHELTRQGQVITVGIWDLDAWVGGLPRIIDALNASTPSVTFFEVQSPIPAGIVWQPERLGAWAQQALGRALNQIEQDDLTPAILDEAFLELADPVQKDVGVDYLIGLTPARIGGTYGKGHAETFYTDFFSISSGPLSLVSTYELRTFAAQTRRSYEYAVGIVMVGALLVNMNPKLDYHDNRGCLFDFNENRSDIIGTIAQPRIEPSCYQKMESAFIEVAKNTLETLDRYPRPETKLKVREES